MAPGCKYVSIFADKSIRLLCTRYEGFVVMTNIFPNVIFVAERFNETIFDSLPTYLLNICEVCGSSQCPYCAIYNLATTIPVPVLTLLICTVFVIVRQLRSNNGAVI